MACVWTTHNEHTVAWWGVKLMKRRMILVRSFRRRSPSEGCCRIWLLGEAERSCAYEAAPDHHHLSDKGAPQRLARARPWVLRSVIRHRRKLNLPGNATAETTQSRFRY